MLLYKYRALDNFKNFVDIVLKNRIFAAPYFDMNDPMEGHYVHSSGKMSVELIRAIKGEKSRLGICSLSRKKNDPLMWAHYANGHRGVAIGVEVDPEKYDVRPVAYIGPSHLHNAEVNGGPETAKRILCHKYQAWHYEEEERIFVSDGSKFANVQVKEVLLGSRMSKQDKGFIKELLSKINPEVTVLNSETEVLV